MQRPDVLIIGAGVIGSSIAYYAAKAGMNVQVIDAHKAPGNASRVAAGLIAPSPQLTNESPFSQIALASVKLFSALRDELYEHSGIDIQLNYCGTLRIATTEEQATNQQKRLMKQLKLGLDLRWLHPSEVQEFEPTMTNNIYGAVYGPQEGQVNATRLISAYTKAAQLLKANFVCASVKGFLTRKSRVLGIKTDKGNILSGHIVLANGAWSSLLGEQLGIHIPIVPERGQLIAVSHSMPRIRHIVFGGQIYLAPKQQGSLLIGSIKDYVGYTQRTTIAAVSELLTKSLTIFPHLSLASLQSTRVGLRPRTPDGCPIIGPIKAWEGISIAAGHNSNGLLLSAITGQIITAQLRGTAEPINSELYRLERFEVHNAMSEKAS